MGHAVHIFGGGTRFWIRPHLALEAPALGKTALDLAFHAEGLALERWHWEDIKLHLTKSADGDDSLDTVEDVKRRVLEVVEDPETKVIFFSVAMLDFVSDLVVREGGNSGFETESTIKTGKHFPRLKSRSYNDFTLRLTPAPKVIPLIRQKRKDIFLVGFKTIAEGRHATADEIFDAGLTLLKQASCNLVLANDIHGRTNMIVTPEQARYCVTKNRDEVLQELVAMTAARSKLRFTRSTVVDTFKTPWGNVNPVLRAVVEHMVKRGAYRPFLGKTVGHFAQKNGNGTFLTSLRGVDFNDIQNIGMCCVETVNDDEVLAHGGKPSVGGQSQRIIFNTIPDVTSIAHAHVQLKPGSAVPVRSQREFECGSHECGENTARGLRQFGNIWAVMLDRHGPNIVFDETKVTAQEVIDFVEANFDLEHQTSELS